MLAQEKREAKCKGDISKFKTLKREIRKQIRADKKTWLETECSKIDEFDKLHKSKAMFNKIKDLKRKTFDPKQNAIKTKDGTVLFNKEDILKRWQEYGEELFKDNSVLKVNY